MLKFTRDTNGIYTQFSKKKKAVSYPVEGSDNCFSVEDNSFWFRERNHIITDAITRFPFRSSFADIGGGNGYQVKTISETFPRHPAYLIEPIYQGCLNAKKRKLRNVYQTESRQFPYKEKSIGGVGLFDVLEHIKDDQVFLEDIISRVRTKTRIYITVPAFSFLWSAVDDLSGHQRRYTVNDFLTLSRKLSMKPLFITYFFSYLTLPMILGRGSEYMKNMWSHTPKKLTDELPYHTIHPVVSSILTPMHAWERTMVRNTRMIPFGTSLLGVFETK